MQGDIAAEALLILCRAYIASVPLLLPGQSMSFLFKLSKAGVPDGGSARNTDALPTLGRMEIQWKGPMGEVSC